MYVSYIQVIQLHYIYKLFAAEFSWTLIQILGILSFGRMVFRQSLSKNYFYIWNGGFENILMLNKLANKITPVPTRSWLNVSFTGPYFQSLRWPTVSRFYKESVYWANLVYSPYIFASWEVCTACMSLDSHSSGIFPDFGQFVRPGALCVGIRCIQTLFTANIWDDDRIFPLYHSTFQTNIPTKL